VKLAVVVQRYGAEINGGAELHARYVAEHLARHADVEVSTTCARDYVTWRNEYPPGEGRVNGVAVRRFPVRRERVVKTFGRCRSACSKPALDADEVWLDARPTGRRSSPPGIARAVHFFSSLPRYHGDGPRGAGARLCRRPSGQRPG
jgi:hypothetical protein